jgi:hypothetical protein
VPAMKEWMTVQPAEAKGEKKRMAG